MGSSPESKTLDREKLREEALRRIQERHATLQDMPPADVRKLVQDLELYQVELEVQNEDLRRAQTALSVALDRYRELYEGAPVGYLTLSPDGKVLRANSAATHLCSREFEKLEGHSFSSMVHVEDRQRLWLLLRSVGATGRLQAGEFRLDRPQAMPRWVHADAGVLNPAEGVAGGYRLTLIDISARKQQEAQLAEQARLLDLSNDAIIVRDTTDRVIYWSRGAQALYGFTAEEALGQSVHVLLKTEYPEPLPRLHRHLEVNHSWEGEALQTRKDGMAVMVLSRWALDRPSPGHPASVLQSDTDMTWRKLAEEKLRRSEARLTQAIRVAGLGTFEHDHRTEQVDFSPEAREIMGFEPNEEVNIPKIVERVVPEQREAIGAAIQAAHDPAGPGRYDVEARIRLPDGRFRWVGVRSQTFFETVRNERRLLRTVGAALDITERKEFQLELERLVSERTARLQELIGDLEHFSYTITHDMRAPLRAMTGYAQMVSQNWQKHSDDERQQLIYKIITSAERMDALITDALNYGRAVRHDLSLETVDLGALLRGMLDTYPEFQPSRLRIGLEGNLPLVLGNEAGLTQCFSNLLGNAVKFAKPGELPEIRVRAEPITGSQEETWTRIWIEDNGIGIGPELLPRVFNMFSRGSKEYPGTGIGLALVRKVVQRMGGRTGVQSELGNGSRFWLELRTVVPAAPAETQQDQAVTDMTAAPQGTVLYVEDEETDALFMRHAFADRVPELKLHVVDDGSVALDYLSGKGQFEDRQAYPVPDLVLLDLNLPRVQGFDVLAWMRQHPRYAATQVVIFSSSSREEDKARARELGANDYIEKPSSALHFRDVALTLRGKWLAASHASP